MTVIILNHDKNKDNSYYNNHNNNHVKNQDKKHINNQKNNHNNMITIMITS